MDKIEITTMGVAFVIGLSHTIAGPDHYVPFILLSRARKWNVIKTTWVTLICGIGHLASTILLGTVIVALFKLAEDKVVFIEEHRGNIAAWLMIITGGAYMIWGLIRGIKNKKHKHIHLHNTGLVHDHLHNHIQEHDHLHKEEKITNITPWVLFIIFFLGPCEAMLPLFFQSASVGWFSTFKLASSFSIATLLTMLTIVVSLSYGLKFVKFGFMERYMNAMAGLMILLSGLGIVVLGL